MTSARLKLDYDHAAPLDIADRLYTLAKFLDCGVRFIQSRPTRRGWHIEAVIERELPPLAIVAAQAILGSDPGRERFNLVRALVLDKVPAFWRREGRWNVLYRAKSKEVDSMTVEQKGYGSGNRRPAWTAADLGKANVAVLTIREVEPDVVIPARDGDEARKVLVLTFEEDDGEKAFYTNYTMVGYLIQRLSDNERKWPGQKVPIERVTVPNPQTGKSIRKLWIAAPDDWDQHIKAVGRGKKSGTRR